MACRVFPCVSVRKGEAGRQLTERMFRGGEVGEGASQSLRVDSSGGIYMGWWDGWDV